MDGKKRVLIGHRLSAKKVRESEHAAGSSMDAQQKEDAEKLVINAQTQEMLDRCCCF